jgi:hypothetical protein
VPKTYVVSPAVIMHRDIVPRAFACDYSLVADLLARVGDGFREHGCLQNPNGRQVGAPASQCSGAPNSAPTAVRHPPKSWQGVQSLL